MATDSKLYAFYILKSGVYVDTSMIISEVGPLSLVINLYYWQWFYIPCCWIVFTPFLLYSSSASAFGLKMFNGELYQYFGLKVFN